MAQLSENEAVIKWEKEQKCEIYNQSEKRWIEAKVIDVFKDDEGEWVKVKYGRKYEDIPPDSSDIRPLEARKEMELFKDWKVGSLCELYSREERQWIEGEIINMFRNEFGDWIRVQFGQRVRDVYNLDVERDLRARGARTLAVFADDIKNIKNVIRKYPPSAPIFERIFARSGVLALDGKIQS